MSQSKFTSSPFAGLTQQHLDLIDAWFQDVVQQSIASSLKAGPLADQLQTRMRQQLAGAMQAQKFCLQTQDVNILPFSVPHSDLLSELKTTRMLLNSSQKRLALYEQKLQKQAQSLTDVEAQYAELRAELRQVKKRLNQVLEKLAQQGFSCLKSHYVGRILVHALKQHYQQWQQTSRGERYRHRDFYKLFPRSLYAGLLKEIELLLGETNYDRIAVSLENYVFQQKGSPVLEWPDEDPIYQTRLVGQKQLELLSSLHLQQQKRRNFSQYLEKKLAKSGFTPLHGQLLTELVQFALTKQPQPATPH
jgi:uncharacterized coiled-coil protein SlyX